MRGRADTWCSPLSMSFLSPVSCWGSGGKFSDDGAMLDARRPEMGADSFGLITVDIFDLHTAVVYIAGKKVGLIRGARRDGWSPGPLMTISPNTVDLFCTIAFVEIVVLRTTRSRRLIFSSSTNSVVTAEAMQGGYFRRSELWLFSRF